jgi:hypothetical protein
LVKCEWGTISSKLNLKRKKVYFYSCFITAINRCVASETLSFNFLNRVSLGSVLQIASELQKCVHETRKREHFERYW